MKTTATSIKCDQTGCNYVAVHDQEAVANRMISRHKSITHGIRSAKAISNDKYRKKQGARVGLQFGKRFVSVDRSVPVSGSRNGNGMIPYHGEVKCDYPGCDYSYRHADPIVAKRVIGIHKTKSHGLVSDYAKKMARISKNKVVRQQQPIPNQTSDTLHEAPPQKTSSVVPAYLCECPNCKTRFYMAKGE